MYPWGLLNLPRLHAVCVNVLFRSTAPAELISSTVARAGPVVPRVLLGAVSAAHVDGGNGAVKLTCQSLFSFTRQQHRVKRVLI